MLLNNWAADSEDSRKSVYLSVVWVSCLVHLTTREHGTHAQTWGLFYLSSARREMDVLLVAETSPGHSGSQIRKTNRPFSSHILQMSSFHLQFLLCALHYSSINHVCVIHKSNTE